MAIISAAAAAPTADATVPEARVHPSTHTLARGVSSRVWNLQLSLVQSDAFQNAKAAADAKNTVQQMLETGSDSSTCKDLADSILTEVDDNIKSQEEVRIPRPPKPFDVS